MAQIEKIEKDRSDLKIKWSDGEESKFNYMWLRDNCPTAHDKGCFCGEIKFSVDLDEKPRVFNCHCIDCRKKIGGMITIIQLRNNALEIDKSKLGIFEHNGASGNIIKKHYCKKCVAPVMTYVKKWDR